MLWSKRVNAGAEVDGRFGARVAAEVTAAVVVTDTDSLADITQALTDDAAGDIARSGNPPPPFGREAGVYANDGWEGTIHALVPRGPRRAGFWINTATGSGGPQVQAFPSLLSYDDSAKESVGMYGNVYDLTIAVAHDGSDRESRRVRILFGSLVSASLSRYWDGTGLLDGAVVVLRHTPDNRVTTLADFDLPGGDDEGFPLQCHGSGPHVHSPGALAGVSLIRRQPRDVRVLPPPGPASGTAPQSGRTLRADLGSSRSQPGEQDVRRPEPHRSRHPP